MKCLICYLFFISGLFANSWSIQDEKDLLSEIDTLCGDTWCESDSDYVFKALKCDFEIQTCVMTFDVIPWGTPCDRELCQRIEKQCVIDKLKNTKDLFSRKSGFFRVDEKFYSRLGNCVNERSDEAYKGLISPC